MAYSFGGANTTLDGAITATQTTMVLVSAVGFTATPCLATIMREGSNTSEIVLIKSIATLTATIVRAYRMEGWAPRASAHATGASVQLTVPSTAVYTALSTAIPQVAAGTGAPGTSLKASRDDHVHPV